MNSSAFLTFLSGCRKGYRFVLPANRELRVGRSPGAEIQILDDLVSRHHARIQIGSSITVHDLGSRNGTFVNGRRIDRATIVSGDRVEFGTAVGEVFIPTRATSRDTQPRLTATMAGQLSEIPLADVLQLLCASKKTGVIGIATQAHQAKIEVHRGNVSRAQIEGRDYEDFKALTRILTWRHGDFSLLPQDGTELPAEEPLMGSTQRALMEAMRHIDELNRALERLGGPDAILQAIRSAPPPLQELPRAIVRLARDRDCTLQRCLDEIGAPDLDIVRRIVELLEHGSLKAQLGGDSLEPLLAPTDESLRLDLAFSDDRDGF